MKFITSIDLTKTKLFQNWAEKSNVLEEIKEVVMEIDDCLYQCQLLMHQIELLNQKLPYELQELPPYERKVCERVASQFPKEAKEIEKIINEELNSDKFPTEIKTRLKTILQSKDFSFKKVSDLTHIINLLERRTKWAKIYEILTELKQKGQLEDFYNFLVQKKGSIPSELVGFVGSCINRGINEMIKQNYDNTAVYTLCLDYVVKQLQHLYSEYKKELIYRQYRKNIEIANIKAINYFMSKFTRAVKKAIRILRDEELIDGKTERIFRCIMEEFEKEFNEKK